MNNPNTRVPRIVIFVEGGLIQEVIADQEARIVIVERDVEGSQIEPVYIEGERSLLTAWIPGGEDADHETDRSRIDPIFEACLHEDREATREQTDGLHNAQWDDGDV